MLRNLIKPIYYKIVPELKRKQIYKFLHRSEFKDIRTVVYPSNKGNFSLRGFDREKAIFVHIPKAAGTSIALSIFGELPFHYTAIDYIAIFGQKNFNEYFKFAFVRNPWDRLYSAYCFLRNGGWDDTDRKWAEQNIYRFDDFSDFVINWINSDNIFKYMHFIPQHKFLCDHRGNILVNYIGYFETISEDFNKICKIMNNPATLSHTNKSTSASYVNYYNDTTISIVGEIYKKDIELFGYKFDKISNKNTLGI